MKALVLTFSLLSLLSSISAQPAASQSQAGDFLFQIPQGWQRTDQPPKTFLMPPAAAADNSTYIQIAGFDLGDNDLQAGFNAEVQGISRQYQILNRTAPALDHSPNGFDYYHCAILGKDQNGKQWLLTIIGAQYGKRLETVLFASSEMQPQTRTTYLNGLQTFLLSVRFAPSQQTQQDSPMAAASPGKPAPRTTSGRGLERDMSLPPSGPMSFNQLPTVPGKFSGIFRAPVKPGTDLTSTLDIADPSRNTPDYQFLVLFSDGTALRGLPDIGLNGYKASVRLDISGGGNAAAKWGLYRMAGDRGRVVFASPTAAGQQLVSGRLVGDAWNIQEYADRLDINGNSYTRLDDGGAGFKLEGTYRPFGNTKQPGITFTRDGRFVDEGILKTGGATAIGIVGGGLAIGYAFNSPGPGPGTYHIANYTLNLNYSNGQAPPVLFWIDPATPDAQIIWLTDVKFQRVK
jgi:hypothetical protein